MTDWYRQAECAAQTLRDALGLDAVDAAVVLGSGWAPAVGALGERTASVPMAMLPGFLEPVAPGHLATASAHLAEGRRVLVLAGRTHLYEGHEVGQVTHGVRTAAALGAKTIVLTNANGSLCHDWPLGQIVALSDHLNLTGRSPLLGARFVDLTGAYDAELRTAARKAAAELLGAEPDHRELPEGVYAMLPGPHFETAAEAHMIQRLGADLLGMSTVLETIAAREAGMRVLALSTVTAHEASGQEIDPDEVVAIAERSAERFGPVIARVLAEY